MRQQPDGALAALRKAVCLGGEISRPQAVLGAYLAVGGRRDEARHILDRLLTRVELRYVPPTSLAAQCTPRSVKPQRRWTPWIAASRCATRA